MIACAPPSSGWNPELLDRVVLAAAVGDAWGYPVEFWTVSAMDEAFGVDGLRAPQPLQGPLIVSDDTQMLLFTVDGMTGAHQAPDADARSSFLRAYQAWYSTQHNRVDVPGAWYDLPTMRVQRAPGMTCLSALGMHRRGTAQDPMNDSKGCGGVMRTGVIGAWSGISSDRAWHLGEVAAALTHGHPDGRWPSAWIAAWIARASDVSDNGASIALDGLKTPSRWHAFKKGWAAEAQRLNLLDPHSGTARLMALAQELPLTITWDQAWTQLGQGWVGDEALAIAAYAVRRAQSFEEAVFRAVRHDGDSDSTGALAAQLWAAWFGLPASTVPLVRRLDVLNAWKRLRATLPMVSLPAAPNLVRSPTKIAWSSQPST